MVYPPTGSTAYEREMSTPPTLLWSMALLYLYRLDGSSQHDKPMPPLAGHGARFAVAQGHRRGPRVVL